MLVGNGGPQDLVKLSGGIGGVAIVQALGPLKRAVAGSESVPAMKLELRSEDTGGVVLHQSGK